jgi:2-polyprenyl-3-methyl-5-hydroxy-6-metoxy-1,4-benzoquinol methylase
MTMNTEQLAAKKAEVVALHGEWTAHNIHLGGGLYTMGEIRRGDEILARRILQTAADITGRPLGDLRVLDLACLEGLYAIEFARHGAEAVGVEIREANLAKARFAGEALGLERLSLVQDDVRNLSAERYGAFDVVLCLGILYHLDAPDVFDFVHRMAAVTRRCLVVDTHVSTTNEVTKTFGGREYAGKYFVEHAPDATPEEKERMLWASIDNVKSFWLTRSSLDNLLAHAGFTSVYECHNPAVSSRAADRVTLVAVKGEPQEVISSPLLAREPVLEWPLDETPAQTAAVPAPAHDSLLRKLGRRAPAPIRDAARRLLRRG